MKYLKLFMLVTITMLFGCTSDSSDDDNQNNSANENYKLIKKVEYPAIPNYDGSPNGTESMEFIYVDGLLEAVKDGSWISNIIYEDGKIVRVEGCYGLVNSSGVVTCNGGVLNSWQDYIYENDKVVRISNGPYGPYFYDLTYNNEGYIVFKDQVGSYGVDENDDYGEDVSYVYDDFGNVIQMTIIYRGDSSIHRFTNDGKKNPFYPLWKLYGYYASGVDRGLYGVMRTFFKQNSTAIYNSNGNLRYSAQYIYDADGYPLSCTYISYSRNGTPDEPRTINFTYYE